MPVPIIMALASLVPSILPLFTKNETAVAIAETVAGVAHAVTGKGTDQEALAALQADPALLMQFQQATMAHALGLAMEETKRLEAINATMRHEASNEDPYVRRWRPTWGYSTALVWTTQGLAFAYICAFEPQYAAEVGTGLAAMTAIWSVALAVLGLSVYSRSKDKEGKGSPDLTGLVKAFRRVKE